MKKKKEPEQLIRGKAFHKKIQKQWELESSGIVMSEKTILKRNSRKGRIDILVDTEDPNGCGALVEIKASDWDKMTEVAVRRNINRQARQIHGYLESQFDGGEYVPTGLKKTISIGIIFPKRPKSIERQKFIEETFLSKDVTVVWEDESIEVKRARSIK
ncbi:MAG: hypothetical protein GQ534_00755 [Candidatus Delongbacteria bacterium]|nr:hypothetical protein [Candidatus Delongbacteria bacterium]